jgi:hypothetical protein
VCEKRLNPLHWQGWKSTINELLWSCWEVSDCRDLTPSALFSVT